MRWVRSSRIKANKTQRSAYRVCNTWGIGRVYCVTLSISRPDQNNRHINAADISNCIFLNKNNRILIQILPKFVPKVLNDSIAPGNGLGQAITWTNDDPVH